MWSNFHMHSQYCDGKGEMHEYATRARELDAISVGFSSHAPIPFPCKWCMKSDDLSAYLSDIENLNASYPEVEIYKGLEVDFIPGIISPDQFSDRLDYTIGSIHFVEKFPDGTPWEIDGLHTLFMDGLESIFRGNIRDAVTRYFEITREMIDKSCPTIVGHLDKIKIQNPEDKFFHERDPWYQAEIATTIDLFAAAGVIVEVNTRGIYQKKSSTAYPSPWILARLCEKNIPITLSSDAHHPADIFNQFTDTAKLLLDIGFRSLMVLHEGKWKPFLFDTHGIIQ